ncbi:polysaccharide pyruvyl transferase CsaB [Oceanobacillus sp. Castelsardo]|uniref:polysaccharide pyruvyl transferase CsaB n=1 Tax=Oceanobacillus sp. Castelsardo TaxID=1851204 RepID=UPI000838DEED|nr:polysaccharide pyruvyl transferase CsaB [Oceanobacillus sp. Castelsardo]
MHVVLSGYYGFDNCGDEAILYSIIQGLRSIQADINITVLSNNPKYTKKMYGVNSVDRHHLGEISAVMKKADGLISGGGSLLQDKTGLKSIPYYSGIIQLAKFYKKPVFVYAQGMGPISSKLSKWIVKNTLNKVEHITVRDLDSQRLLDELGVRKDSTIVPDPVLGLNSSSFSCDWQGRGDGPIVAVSVRDWPSGVTFKGYIAEALDKLAKKGYSVVFVPMHGKHDEKASMDVANSMQETSEIFPCDCEIEEKIAIIGKADLLIGMRLHSLIFSAITYTPFIAISYDPKIDSFAEICKQPVIGHVEKNDWDGEALFTVAESILVDEERKRAKLKECVEPYQAQALHTPMYALETLGKKRA